MIVTDEMKEICRRIAELYKRQLEEDGAVATGELRDSVDDWHTEADDLSFSLFFSLPRYWKFAPENERTGHRMPPVKAIKDWIDAKHLDLNEWAVAKTIAEVGWQNQPRKNLQDVIDSNEMEVLINELVRLIEEQIIDDTLNDL